MQNQKRELVEGASRMAEFGGPSLSLESDFDPVLCDIHHSNLFRVHREYHRELCHSLV